MKIGLLGLGTIGSGIYEHLQGRDDIQVRRILELLRRGVEAGVIWQNGEDFFWPDSIRMNLALPLAKVREAFDRLDRYVFHGIIDGIG